MMHAWCGLHTVIVSQSPQSLMTDKFHRLQCRLHRVVTFMYGVGQAESQDNSENLQTKY